MAPGQEPCLCLVSIWNSTCKVPLRAAMLQWKSPHTDMIQLCNPIHLQNISNYTNREEKLKEHSIIVFNKILLAILKWFLRLFCIAKRRTSSCFETNLYLSMNTFFDLAILSWKFPCWLFLQWWKVDMVFSPNIKKVKYFFPLTRIWLFTLQNWLHLIFMNWTAWKYI